MKSFTVTFLFFVLNFAVHAQITKPEVTEVWDPEPRVVTAGSKQTSPPSDAIVLFDGSSSDNFTHNENKPVEWIVNDGIMTVKAGSGQIQTKEAFGDIQLHLEFRTPAVVEGEGQGRGNSGVFLQGRYEVQILDNFENRTYANGQCASVYKQSPPLVNACKPPGEWQTYDIIFTAPVFNADGMRIRAGSVTVLQNGILVQNNTLIQGTTEYIGIPKNISHGDGPIFLQDHGNPMSFRNIWVRKL